MTIRIFTADGAYTPTAGMKFVHIRLIGGGGGGGGADTSTTTSDVAAGGGGSSGCETAFWLTAAQVTTFGGLDVVVGIGGSAGSNAGGDGGNGGSTVVADTGTGGGAFTVSGDGGQGGLGSGTSTAQFCARAGGLRSSGFLPDLATGISSNDGEPGVAIGSQAATVAGFAKGGDGAPGPLAGAGQGGCVAGLGSTAAAAQAGRNAAGFGAGGGGAAAMNTTAGAVGGTGSPGVAVFEEFI